MDYPILISGRKEGTLSVSADGLYTVFEARIPDFLSNAIIRLYVCGDEKRALLGVMQPEKGGLYLHKKLSRSAMRDYPETILYACREDDAQVAAADGESTTAESTGGEGTEVTVSEQMPMKENTAEESLLWFASGSGVLSAFDGKNSLTAIPASLRRAPPGADIRLIDGKEYIIFRRH